MIGGWHADGAREGAQGFGENLAPVPRVRRAGVDVSSALAFDSGTGAAHATVETRAASATTSKVELVQEGIDAVSRGDCRDALEAVASLRGKYGL